MPLKYSLSRKWCPDVSLARFKEEHIVHLLKTEGMTIGSHAILWDVWETESAKLGELCIKTRVVVHVRTRRIILRHGPMQLAL